MNSLHISLALLPHVTQAAGLPCSREAFADFKNKFHKTYGSTADEEKHYKAFCDNMATMQDDPTQGVTQFSDLTDAEFEQQFMGRVANTARNDLDDPRWDGNCTACVRFPELSGPAPDSIDWSTRGAVTPIKKQLCGDCYTFSTTGDIEGSNFLAGNKLVSLSEEQIIDCCMDDMGILSCAGCNGGMQEDVMDWLKKKGGIDSEATYPYSVTKHDPHPGTCDKSKLTPKDYAVKISGWFRVSGGARGEVTGKDIDENAMKQQLAKVGPLAMSIASTAAGMKQYSSGVADPSNCKIGVKLDHAVLVVGYGTDGGVDYWKIKNSWGDSWGENGYYRIVRGKNACGVAEDVLHSKVEKVIDTVVV